MSLKDLSFLVSIFGVTYGYLWIALEVLNLTEEEFLISMLFPLIGLLVIRRVWLDD